MLVLERSAMITYALPDFTVNLGLNLFFVRLAAQRPEYFMPDVRIGSMYGCFPGCALNGGRAFVREPYSENAIEETFALLDAHGVDARLTLTQMFVDETLLHDAYFERIMRAARGHQVEAIVYADELNEFLKRTHPEMPRILSTTREILDIEAFNRAAQEYSLVVLNYMLHRNDAFLQAIEQPCKVEVMVNEFCAPGCPHRAEHYRQNSLDQKQGSIRPFSCIQPASSAFFEHAEGHPVILTNNDVRRLHDEYGIENFKIVGRGVPFATVLEALVYYLIKPAYRESTKRMVLAFAQKS